MTVHFPIGTYTLENLLNCVDLTWSLLKENIQHIVFHGNKWQMGMLGPCDLVHVANASYFLAGSSVQATGNGHDGSQ